MGQALAIRTPPYGQGGSGFCQRGEECLSGVHMFLNPGASRELHWHAIAAEWAFIIEGRCQTVVIEPSGASEINNYEPGDLWYFAKGHGHSKERQGEGGKIWDRIRAVAEANDCVPHMLQVLNAVRKARLRVFYALHHRYRPGDYETWKYVTPIQKAAW